MPRYHGIGLIGVLREWPIMAIRVVPTIVIVPEALASGAFYFEILGDSYETDPHY